MTTEWLLISVYEGIDTAAVVAVGSSPRPFLPLEHQFTTRRTGVNKKAVAGVVEALTMLAASPSLEKVDVEQNNRRTWAIPLRHDNGSLHAAYVWRGPVDETPSPRRPAGAWEFDLTVGTAHGSSDLFDLYGVPDEDRRSGVAQAGAFDRLRTNADEGAAYAKIVNSVPGTQHQAVWTVERNDGAMRAAHFSCRMVEDKTNGHVILRGVTQDIGAAENVQAAPPPTILEHRVLEAISRPGEYRAIVDLKRLRLIRWHGDPMPGIAWESVADQPKPELHPDDAAIAQAMSRQLATASPVAGVLRFRGLSGEWVALHVQVALMALDQSTTGGLALVSAVGGQSTP